MVAQVETEWNQKDYDTHSINSINYGDDKLFCHSTRWP